MRAAASAAPAPLLLHLSALFGTPGDRESRLAARRRFVEMKQCFIAAVAGVPGGVGAALRHEVRQSADPMDLWRLRRAVLAALPALDPRAAEHRKALQEQLDTISAAGLDTTGFVAF